MTIEPAKLNFDGQTKSGDKIKQGSTWIQGFTYYEPDDAVVDLSSAVIKMQIRNNVKSAVVVELSTANGKITVGQDGKVTLTLTAAQTAAIPPGRYIYDLVYTVSTTQHTLLEGEVIVSPSITR